MDIHGYPWISTDIHVTCYLLPVTSSGWVAGGSPRGGSRLGRGWVGRGRRRRPTRTETETETETTTETTETETNSLAPCAPQTNAPRDDICRSGLSANHPHSD